MGYAIAAKLVKEGAEVTLVSGPTNQIAAEGIKLIKVQTAQQMYEACIKEFPEAKVTILSAAVADYTPKVVATQKIKKKDAEFSIDLVKTKDIARELGQQKKDNQVMVGFALETNNEVENAKGKLESKNLDFIVLNSMNNKGTCFGSDNNKISIIDHNKITDFELKSKELVASDIVNFLSSYLEA
jgi:phosphopantothenoylcysteine decarboxylase/phosphopantothenate--cysteine ligase